MELPKSSHLAQALGAEDTLLAVLADSEGKNAYAFISYNENYQLPFLFHFAPEPGNPIILSSDTSLGLAIKVGDRWINTEDLDVISEDEIATLVGILATAQTMPNYGIPQKEQAGA